MEVLPQTWIVLGIFAGCLILNVSMVIFNDEYRKKAFKNTLLEMLYAFASMFVMAVVMLYSVQCSVKGSYVMPSCNTFSWVLTVLLLAMFAFNVVTKSMTWAKDANEDK